MTVDFHHQFMLYNYRTYSESDIKIFEVILHSNFSKHKSAYISAYIHLKQVFI